MMESGKNKSNKRKHNFDPNSQTDNNRSSRFTLDLPDQEIAQPASVEPPVTPRRNNFDAAPTHQPNANDKHQPPLTPQPTRQTNTTQTGNHNINTSGIRSGNTLGGGRFAANNDNQHTNHFDNQQQKKNENNTLNSQISNTQFSQNASMQTMQMHAQPTEQTTKQSAAVIKKQLLPIDVSFEQMRLILLLALLLPLTIYSYFPALTGIVGSWINKVDYSHGFFVIPLVALFLYSRFDSYPGTQYKLCWFGLIPISICLFMRYQGANYYADALEEWSLLFWVLGIVWFFYGTRVFLWALPSLLFLAFMFQLPFRYEVLMKHNLQAYAAQLAAAMLNLLNEPAIPMNNIIRIKGEELSVEAACSGIRFLISVFAISFAAVLFMKKPWWQNIFVILIAAPLAMFVNAARITMTGILILHHRVFLANFVPPERVSAFADEVSGYTMIVVVAVIFLLFLLFIDKVFKQVKI
ncbi:MAG: exosortase/archaeosortase family protein [Planctomycetaceae bacterium]|jgi:exosortase|nr:exosortase/archaeosortase family protein [Planctomycetaceae bacterium]